jgi:hypothetical protein
VSWSSDLDGPLGTGGTVTTTLSLGAHTVTATVTDSDGHVASHAIAINVELPGDPPSVSITAPASGTTVTSGDTVTLEGSASDPDDGDLTSAIAWSSDRDGDLGTGGSLIVTLSDGTHVVTATVVDSHDREAQDVITVTVEGGVLVSSISQLGYGGRSSDKHLDSTVTVTDSDGFAVAGASVSVTLLRAGDPSMNGATTFATAQGTTSGGTTVLSFKNLPSGCYRTVVTAVTADDATWDGFSPPPDPDPWCK